MTAPLRRCWKTRRNCWIRHDLLPGQTQQSPRLLIVRAGGFLRGFAPEATICLPFLTSGLYRWSRNRTGSAPTKGGRGLGEISHCHCTPLELFCFFGTLRQRKQLPYRQWGITPRPETNFLAQSIACRPRLVKRKLFDLYIFYQSIPFLFSSQPCSGGCDMIS